MKGAGATKQSDNPPRAQLQVRSFSRRGAGTESRNPERGEEKPIPQLRGGSPSPSSPLGEDGSLESLRATTGCACTLHDRITSTDGLDKKHS